MRFARVDCLPLASMLYWEQTCLSREDSGETGGEELRLLGRTYVVFLLAPPWKRFPPHPSSIRELVALPSNFVASLFGLAGLRKSTVS